jgi:hypothetical protein
MCDRCTALEIAVSEQRMMIDAKDAEIAMLKTELARCRWIIGDLQTRHATLKVQVAGWVNKVEAA